MFILMGSYQWNTSKHWANQLCWFTSKSRKHRLDWTLFQMFCLVLRPKVIQSAQQEQHFIFSNISHIQTFWLCQHIFFPRESAKWRLSNPVFSRSHWEMNIGVNVLMMWLFLALYESCVSGSASRSSSVKVSLLWIRLCFMILSFFLL